MKESSTIYQHMEKESINGLMEVSLKETDLIKSWTQHISVQANINFYYFNIQ